MGQKGLFGGMFRHLSPCPCFCYTIDVMILCISLPGEPNDSGSEHCAELYVYNGKWNDNKCENMYGYICKKNGEYVDKIILLWCPRIQGLKNLTLCKYGGIRIMRLYIQSSITL